MLFGNGTYRGEELDSLSTDVRDFYLKRGLVRKIDEIPDILRLYEGKEEELMTDLEAKYGEDCSFRNPDPKVIIIAGTALAGKSSLGQHVAEIFGAVLLDKDTVEKNFLTLFPEKEYTNALEGAVYKTLFDMTEEAVTRCNNSVVLVGPFTNQVADSSFTEQLAKRCRLPKHSVVLVYMTCSLEKKKDRALDKRGKIGDMEWKRIQASEKRPNIPHLYIDTSLVYMKDLRAAATELVVYAKSSSKEVRKESVVEERTQIRRGIVCCGPSSATLSLLCSKMDEDQVEAFAFREGGPIGATAKDLVSLCGKSCPIEMMTVVDDDIFGNFLLQRWKEMGIGASKFVTVGVPTKLGTGTSLVISNNLNETFLYKGINKLISAQTLLGVSEKNESLSNFNRCVIDVLAGDAYHFPISVSSSSTIHWKFSMDGGDICFSILWGSTVDICKEDDDDKGVQEWKGMEEEEKSKVEVDMRNYSRHLMQETKFSSSKKAHQGKVEIPEEGTVALCFSNEHAWISTTTLSCEVWIERHAPLNKPFQVIYDLESEDSTATLDLTEKKEDYFECEVANTCTILETSRSLGALRNYSWFHCQASSVLSPKLSGHDLTALLRTVSRKVPISIDLNGFSQDSDREILKGCLRHVTVVHADVTEAAAACGRKTRLLEAAAAMSGECMDNINLDHSVGPAVVRELSAALLTKGCGIVIITLGSSGAFASVADRKTLRRLLNVNHLTTSEQAAAEAVASQLAGRSSFVPAFQKKGSLRRNCGAGDAFISGCLSTLCDWLGNEGGIERLAGVSDVKVGGLEYMLRIGCASALFKIDSARSGDVPSLSFLQTIVNDLDIEEPENLLVRATSNWPLAHSNLNIDEKQEETKFFIGGMKKLEELRGTIKENIKKSNKI
eukprot:g4367.t1